ncbi:MAG: adenylate/guanylate cyclase domain-containing protein [Bacteroidia bacterium]|nr:adenylate/guanylate cyclase domain-containing protein [Bacteroidia bacterium]
MARLTRTTQSRLRHIGFSILTWIPAALLFDAIRLLGVPPDSQLIFAGAQVAPMLVVLVRGVTMGLCFGTLFGLVDLLVDRNIFKQTPYGLVVLIRTVAHVLVTSLILILAAYAGYEYSEDPGTSVASAIGHELYSPTSWILLIYTGVVSVLFNLFRQVNAMFGPGILTNIISGKYHQPQEEARIFMFVDLKSSTTYAERLGHKLYSELIQDCFYDLTDTLIRYEVEVYQYVGDEAVLTWRVEDGLRDGNCIEAYYSFEAQIRSRAREYFNKYGLVPAFKAGANTGMVMVAEVGVIKKEIAYHSDVLNTAARIQGRCNELGKRLLISEHLRNQLPPMPGYHIEEVGSVPLKGKETAVTLFSVQPVEEVENVFVWHQ